MNTDSAQEGFIEQALVSSLAPVSGLAPEESSEAVLQALAKVNQKQESHEEMKRKKEKTAALADVTNLNHSLTEARHEEAIASRVHAEAAAKATARLKLAAFQDSD